MLTDMVDARWPIGARVRFRPEVVKWDWVGVVAGHPSPHSLELDGSWRVGAGLLERVDEMGGQWGHPVPQEQATAMLDLQRKLNDMTLERDGLAEIVAMQMELIAAPAPPTTSKTEAVGTEWLESLRRLLNYWGEDWHRTPDWRPRLKLDSPFAKIVAHIDRGPR